jgi:hypothetical protein
MCGVAAGFLFVQDARTAVRCVPRRSNGYQGSFEPVALWASFGPRGRQPRAASSACILAVGPKAQVDTRRVAVGHFVDRLPIVVDAKGGRGPCCQAEGPSCAHKEAIGRQLLGRGLCLFPLWADLSFNFLRSKF